MALGKANKLSMKHWMKARAKAKKDKRRHKARRKAELPKEIISGFLVGGGKIGVHKRIVKALHYTMNLDKYENIWFVISHNPIKKVLDIRVNLRDHGNGIKAVRGTGYWIAKAPRYLDKYVRGTKVVELVSRRSRHIAARL